MLAAALPAHARSHRKKSAASAVKQGKPEIQQVQPPNWWSGLPNPMVLLHGKNLLDAKISSSADGISVRRTKISANGHWAFAWLDIASAPPQKFSLIVHTTAGTAKVPYELEKRHAPEDGFHGFSPADVLYLVMPDRFADGDPSNDKLRGAKGAYDRANPNAYHGGDLLGLENHLDYIRQLGATAIWVTPLYAQDPTSPSDYSGYAPVDLYSVNPHFGTLQDYTGLVDKAHGQGMKVVLDMVLNHVGPNSPWALDPPDPDWFHGSVAQHIPASDDFGPMTDPHAAPSAQKPVVDGWIFNTLPDLNQSNPLVRQYLIQNAVWWVEAGALDGLRLDTFPHVDRVFWQSFHSMLHALYPHLTTVGEIDTADPSVAAYFAGGVKHDGIDTGLYSTFDFPSFFALRASLAGDAPLTRITDVQRQDWLYPHPDRLTTFFGNQDVPRFLAQPGATPARMKLAYGLIATLRGMPQIYFGDELALTGANASDNRQDFPGGFPGDTNNAFTAAGRTPAQQAMFTWVQGLLQLRAQHPVLQTGLQQDLLADSSGMVYVRFPAPPSGRPGAAAATGELMIVALNKSNAPRTFHLDLSRTVLDGVTSLTPAWNVKAPVAVSQNQCDISVPAGEFLVLSAQR